MYDYKLWKVIFPINEASIKDKNIFYLMPTMLKSSTLKLDRILKTELS